nr:3-keto-5-aminohexanoate cleavage protein [uncultured Roseovarius sp.]
MTPLPRLMVAPNGARHGKAYHPALPVTLSETVEVARACHAAGADGLHLHLRDADGAHLLDAVRYRDALALLAEAVPGMAVQITTEAAGRYEAAHQRAVALAAGARLVSMSIREIRSGTRATEARDFYETCAAQGIAVQHILYDPQDLALLAETLAPQMLTDPALQVIFVLGRYTEARESTPDDLKPFIEATRAYGMTPDWGLCAFGRHESDCLLAAHRAGGKLRVGFENNITMRDGSIAADNAARVAEVAALIAGCASG